MKKLLTIVLIVLLAMNLTGCAMAWTPPAASSRGGESRGLAYVAEIAEIYVYHSSFGVRDTEYKIDFSGKQLLEYMATDYAERDEMLENEGYTLVGSLDDEKIAAFFEDCDEYGFNDWEEDYSRQDIMDGHQWGIFVTFADGSVKKVHGSNAYPETWNEMKTAFENLTDRNVLQLEKNWLSHDEHDILPDIAEIYVYHSGFGSKYLEYKIDFAKKQVFEYRAMSFGTEERTDVNEGFVPVCDLEDDKIVTFFKESYVVMSWKESYNAEGVYDGHQWGITVTFADGSVKKVHGSNAYPETWNEMKTAFKNLTGRDVL